MERYIFLYPSINIREHEMNSITRDTQLEVNPQKLKIH